MEISLTARGVELDAAATSTSLSADFGGHEPGKEIDDLGFAMVAGPQFGEREEKEVDRLDYGIV